MILAGITFDKDILFVQAYLVLKQRNIKVSQVHYIKTNGAPINDICSEFWQENEIDAKTYNIESKGKFKSEEDFFKIENEIFSWYVARKKIGLPVITLLGGGNTAINISLQRATYLFGAFQTFSVLANFERGEEPKNVAEIENAIKDDKLLLIDCGKETGWPALKYLNDTKNLSQQIRLISKTIESRSIEEINEYPFECINLLPPKAIEWLYGNFVSADEDWIKRLPKTELHCHLGGFAVNGTLLAKVREKADHSWRIGDMLGIQFPEHWPLPDYNISLTEYMHLGDESGSYILKNIGCLKEQINLLYDHFLDQNILYAEVRCSPLNYRSEEYSGIDIVTEIMNTFNAKMEISNNNLNIWCHVNLIIIATRTMDSSTNSIDAHISLATLSETTSKLKGRCKVVAVDLAGFENKETRASLYQENFKPIHRMGIALTIHAGENDEAEGIWEAVFKLNTRRIGHGLNLFQDPKLLKSIVNRRIGIEMCPYANYQIKGFKPKPNSETNYPLLQYLKAGAQVTVNTDNIGISTASLSENYMLLSLMNPELSRMDILQLIRNGIEQAFIDVSLKNKLLNLFNEEIFKIIYIDSGRLYQ